MKWFVKKWGINMNPVPTDDLYEKLAQLDARIKFLEDENIETSNCLYEIYNTIDAVDRRIDILAGEYLPIQEQTNEW